VAPDALVTAQPEPVPNPDAEGPAVARTLPDQHASELAALTPPPPPPAVVAPQVPVVAPALPAADRGGGEAVAERQPEQEVRKLRKPPKDRKIAFNIKGGAIAAAQAKVQVEEAVAAARARRLNTKDASTQTVRDPERQDGDIVTIWRLRPRGMESFPHFPKAAKRKVRESTMCAAAEGEGDEVEAKPEESQRDVRRRLGGNAGLPQKISESPERATVVEATVPEGLQADTLQETKEAAECEDSSSSDDSPASDVVQEMLARTVQGQDAMPV